MPATEEPYRNQRALHVVFGVSSIGLLLATVWMILADHLRLRLKADVRLRPLSAGIDFLGYIVFPTHTRVRPRVVRHAIESLSTWHRDHAVLGAIVATPEDLQRLGSIQASYDGHMRHANSWRLQQSLLKRFPWVPALTRPRKFHHSLYGRRLVLKVVHSRIASRRTR